MEPIDVSKIKKVRVHLWLLSFTPVQVDTPVFPDPLRPRTRQRIAQNPNAKTRGIAKGRFNSHIPTFPTVLLDKSYR
uniref:Uncharacterized protein n=1 Tax=mine drainage metagenome TaxID=410659 RepID=E6QTZ8_9ZZZZ